MKHLVNECLFSAITFELNSLIKNHNLKFVFKVCFSILKHNLKAHLLLRLLLYTFFSPITFELDLQRQKNIVTKTTTPNQMLNSTEKQAMAMMMSISVGTIEKIMQFNNPLTEAVPRSMIRKTSPVCWKQNNNLKCFVLFCKVKC